MINFNQNKENTIISKESLNISNYEDDVNTTTNKKLCNNEEINSKLEYFIEKKKIPHIIFHGESDSEKNKLLLNFIKRIYNYDKKILSDYVMYVNCAHTKGIRFIRDELKFFAKTNIQITNYVLFKSIVLFNADKLTIDAQSALRRCIEQFSNNTRFFIIVENKDNLLKPILSRFCDIYVPKWNTKTNLKLLKKIKNIEISENNDYLNTEYKSKRIKWLKKQLKTKDHFKDLTKCMELAKTLYVKGYSGNCLLSIIKELPNTENKYLFLIYFNKIKKEFRNEEIFMFIILYFVFMRKKIDLENILSF